MRNKTNCDLCGEIFCITQFRYKKNKRHFCSLKCYALFRKDYVPKEEQNAYRGGGMSHEEKQKRRHARNEADYAVKTGVIIPGPCKACGRKDAQMHHGDYDKPLEVTWLCVKCHWDEHKIIYKERKKDCESNPYS